MKRSQSKQKAKSKKSREPNKNSKSNGEKMHRDKVVTTRREKQRQVQIRANFFPDPP